MKWSEIYLKLKCHHRLCKTRQQMGQSQISTQLAEVSHRLSIGSQEMAAWEAWRSPAFKSALGPRSEPQQCARRSDPDPQAFALAPPPPRRAQGIPVASPTRSETQRGHHSARPGRSGNRCCFSGKHLAPAQGTSLLPFTSQDAKAQRV